MSLRVEEKETIIQFDESTKNATIYTASFSVARAFKKIGLKPNKKANGSWWFDIPIDAMYIEDKKNKSTIRINECL